MDGAGSPRYGGYAWYRLRANIQQSDGPLALLMPLYVDDVYQIYANGHEIGHFGDLTRRPPRTYIQTAEWFPLPTTASGQNITLAIRFYMLPSTVIRQADSGGMHGPPRLGAAGVIGGLGDLARERDDRFYA